MEEHSIKIDTSEILSQEVGAESQKKIKINESWIKDNRIKIIKPILGEIRLVHIENGILAQFKLKVRAQFICERCLGSFIKDLEIKFIQRYQFRVYNKKEDRDEILPIPLDRKIEVFEPIREEILASLPMKIICSSNCRGLCSKCGQNLNIKRCKCKTNRG